MDVFSIAYRLLGSLAFCSFFAMCCHLILTPGLTPLLDVLGPHSGSLSMVLRLAVTGAMP